MSLEAIILGQQDEPKQKNCIYQLKKWSGPEDDPLRRPIEKFYQMRVKSIDFLQTQAVAVYFYDFSTQVNMLKLKEELIIKENQNYSLNLS